MILRSRFSELSGHLKTHAATMGVPPENFQGEIARMQLASGGHNCTPQGWHLANLRYRGVLFIERIAQQAAIMLLIQCRAWLDENDDTRDKYKLTDPDVSLVPLDSGDLVDLIVSCDFVDPVYLAEAADGPVEWNGRKLAPVAYDLWTAERGTVNQAPASPEEADK